MNCVAFDLGGSGGKLFSGHFDGSRIALDEVHRFENGAIQLGQGLYWDFLSIWKNLCAGLQKAGRQGKFSSLGIDAFCNDFGFIDAQGRLMGPIHSYRDPRTIRCSEAIYQKTAPETLYRKTGNQTAPFSTLMQLAAMRIEGDDLLMDQADQMLFVPDLMAYYITGERLAEHTLCSVTQMRHADGSGWVEDILKAHNIPQRLFAPVIAPGMVSGKATKGFQAEWNVNGFDFVSVCEHDTASAFLALPGNEDRAIISSGTWAIVGCETESPIVSDYGFRFNFANEGSLPGHNRLLRNVMGTWIIQQLRTEYAAQGVYYDYGELVRLADESEPFAFLIDVDHDDFYSPGNMCEKIRKHCWARKGGQPETPGQLVRCICESLAIKYRYAIERLEKLAGRAFPAISIIGGGARDAMTCQMTASCCAKPVIAGPTDATALGNILVQLLAHGQIGSIEQGRELIANSFSFNEYTPKDHEAWNEVYQAFMEHFGLDTAEA
ncbi:MAG: rhamnulokinase [Clostridia bacterium]|nr:rhamnulokinase [Clostridia bacterium]